ncbi:hypothetical protein BJ508DRAFT_369742 [Ascobolus immersus RN42]|uniref:DNA mismatch repair proteins mutS family domain-containing protein n=1 Tax=Ascobolus immersus RN42 TaxID=1160509 RepID=A0A3N4I876_ASCIM|nr:hypothetical protein BJ508DRAFT_369742 [Ascobolus immersus RN42]
MAPGRNVSFASRQQFHSARPYPSSNPSSSYANSFAGARRPPHRSRLSSEASETPQPWRGHNKSNNNNRNGSSSETPQPRPPGGTQQGTQRGTQGGDDDDDEDETDVSIVAAMDHKGGRVGCAWYSAGEGVLWVMEDLGMADGGVVESLKFQINPTTLLIPYRLDDILLQGKTGSDAGSSEFETPYQLQVRPGTEFVFDKGKEKILALRCLDSHGEGSVRLRCVGDDDLGDTSMGGTGTEGEAGADGGQGTLGRLMRVGGMVDLESRISVGCAGAVLTYLQRKRAVSALPGDQHEVLQVGDLRWFSLRDTMFVDKNALLSLQVFEDESHPNAHMQGRGGRGKEGLSLFGIMNNTRTPQGGYLLRQWFLRPSTSIPLIRERQDAIAVLLRPDNSHVVEAIGKSLRKIKNVPKILSNLKAGKGEGSTGNWNALLQFAFHTLRIRSSVLELVNGENLPLTNRITNTFNFADLQTIGKTIDETIDFAESTVQHRICIKRHVDEELDQMKHTYDGLDSILSQVAKTVVSAIPDFVATTLNVIYFPQLGYLTVVPVNPETGEASYTAPNWEFQFNTATSAYFKSPEMRELDEYFGDMYGLICDREIDIVHELKLAILEYQEWLIKCSTVCAELDALVSLAEAAKKGRYIRPTITDENILDIKGGRHPLQELCVPAYIPNDTFLKGGPGSGDDTDHDSLFSDPAEREEPKPSMLILTGPNYSGKSIHLRTLALLTYLAQIGSFIPCTSAKIGITDKILTRIQTRESCSRQGSAFMIDLQQIAVMLKLQTRRSLLLIDEFGKGTDERDGAGLLAGVLRFLFEDLDDDRPKVAVATHFHELFLPPNPSLPPVHPHISYAHMSILLPTPSTTNSRPSTSTSYTSTLASGQDPITYLYKLTPGISTSSFGTTCALLSGISPAIVDRAEELIVLAAQNGRDLVGAVCGRLGREEMEEVVECEGIARRFLEVEWEGLGDVKGVLGEVLEGEVED